MKNGGTNGLRGLDAMGETTLLLDKIKTLAAINVLQPVAKTGLSRLVKNDVDLASLPTILRELLEEGLITNEKKYYRVTRLGMSCIPSRESKSLRDIYRMKYLLGTSKQRGGDVLGR